MFSAEAAIPSGLDILISEKRFFSSYTISATCLTPPHDAHDCLLISSQFYK